MGQCRKPLELAVYLSIFPNENLLVNSFFLFESVLMRWVKLEPIIQSEVSLKAGSLPTEPQGQESAWMGGSTPFIESHFPCAGSILAVR